MSQVISFPKVTPLTLDEVIAKALELARFGFYVFPCTSTKRPAPSLGKGGYLHAVNDPELIKAMFRQHKQHPWTNIGIACKQSGIFVLDVDTGIKPNGNQKYGIDQLRELEAKYGILPNTARFISGSGGLHYIFKDPGKKLKGGLTNDRGEHLHIELKHNGYIIAPGSTHGDTGERYREDPEAPLAVGWGDAPDWLLTLATDSTPDTHHAPSRGDPRESHIGVAFTTARLLKKRNGELKWAVWCPWEKEHSKPSSGLDDTSTIIWSPKEGSLYGEFFCSHDHCRARRWPEAIQKLREDYPEAIKEADLAYPEAARTLKITKVKNEIGLTLDKDGKIQKSTANLVTVLSTHPDWVGKILGNTFLSQVELHGPPWNHNYTGPFQDEDITSIRVWLDNQGMPRFSKDDTQDAVMLIARDNQFHPVWQYLDQCHHDGTPRLDTFLTDYLGVADSPFTRAVSRTFFIGMVKRIREPGSKHDTMPVLYGKQGVGKSTAMAALMPNPAWFYDGHIDVSNKDTLDAIQGRWLVEWAELSGLRRHEIEAVKSFLTRDTDPFRRAYGRLTKTYPRQCVFVGTTNDPHPLPERGLNRRFPVMATATCRVQDIKKVRDLLWAEADARYKTGERSWLTPEEFSEVEAAQSQYQTEDPWERGVGALLGRSNLPHPLTSPWILEQLGVRDHNPGHMRRVATLLSENGYVAARNALGRFWVKR